MEALLIVLVAVIVTISLYALIWVLISYAPLWSRANRQARELLQAVLTPEQYRQLTRKGHIDITSPSDPQRVYRVPRERGRVLVSENGKLATWLCLQPYEWVPDADHVVIHKLMIEADEETYLQTANRSIAFPLNIELP